MVTGPNPNGIFRSLHCFNATRLQFPLLNQRKIKQVIDNPGTIPDTRYLDGADVTVVFEGKLETYQAENLGCAIMALQDSITDRTALACILHSALVGDGKLRIKKIVQELQKLAGSVFVTELSADYYSSFGTCWQAFVKGMEHGC